MMEDFNAGEEIPWDRGAIEASLRRLLAGASGHDDQGARGAVRRVSAGGHLPAGCAPG
ncbi:MULTISPECIES: hypothetical protein [Sorangium]|uniref:hypothetical protein n=1 Tax=Sorangium TaxID=39643 RepID=UPI001A91A18F|nr:MULTISPECIES: hypothetical protein [Sorangium]